jgi:alanine racemase
MEVALRHLSNTAGAVLFPQAGGNLVRVGIGLYGVHPCDLTKGRIDLRPAMRILSRVSYLQHLGAGERVSYGRIRPLAADSTVATIPIGYADGMPRLLGANGGEVLLNGSRYPLAGRPTMDQIMIDVGDDPVAVGDEVVVLGRQGSDEITAEEWAGKAATIPYEIVCRIGTRLPRRYLE